MKKKILIGSILVVGILIGISFTSVVGYKSIESNVKESPLFKVRTNRAIGEDIKNTLTINHIGKGNVVAINFLIQSRATIIQNIIQKIKNMDDKLFEKLLRFVIQETFNSDAMYAEILQAINIMGEETDVVLYQNNAKVGTNLCQSMMCQTVRCKTVLKGCIGFKLFTALFKILDNLYVFTEKIPLLTGTVVLQLHQILIKLYKAYTTTLPSPD